MSNINMQFCVGERLLTAEHSLGFVVRDLQAANEKADAVQHLLLVDLICDVEALRQRVKALRDAIASRDET